MKEVQIKIPEYLSIGKYQELTNISNSSSKLDKMLDTITALTDYTEKEVRTWSVQAIIEAGNALLDVTTAPNEFYSLVKIGDEVYGYAPLSKSSFGEYVDLENLLKEPNKNLHQIAAILYRPVTKHKFKSFSFVRKYGHDTVNNKVEDPFKWYTVEDYDNELREERSEMMKDFPTQLILGAMGFTSATATMYLSDTQSSNQTMEMNKIQKKLAEELLSVSTGGGSGLYTILPKVGS